MLRGWLSKRAYDKGLRALEQGDYEGALRYAERAIALRYTGGDEVKARALYETGRELEAIAHLEQVVSLHPKVWIFWSYLGEYYSNAARYPEALDAFRRFEVNGGDPGTAQYNYSIVYGRMGDLASALSSVDRAFGADLPKHVIHAARADFLNRLNRHDEALVAIDRAISLEATSASYATRGLILDDMGKHSEALQAIEESLKIEVAEHDALKVISRSNPPANVQTRMWRVTYEGRLNQSHIEPGNLPIDGYLSTFWANADSPEEAMSFLPSVDIVGRDFTLRSATEHGAADAQRKGITHLRGKTFYVVTKNPLKNFLLRVKALVMGGRYA